MLPKDKNHAVHIREFPFETMPYFLVSSKYMQTLPSKRIQHLLIVLNYGIIMEKSSLKVKN